jgi:Arc/MetJ-type ribon-helix-helix transcriptional regulator
MPTPLSDPSLKQIHDRLISLIQGKPEQRMALANHCGVSIGTVNNWLATRPIPDRKIPLIHSFIEANSKSANIVNVPFTIDEIAMIQDATHRGRFDDMADFGRAAMKEKARAIMDKESSRTTDGTDTFPEIAMVAERPKKKAVS